MNAVKRGICISGEMATWVYELSREAKVMQNKVLVRMLQVAREDLEGLDRLTVCRIVQGPWHEAKQLPALRTVMSKRKGGRLRAVTATRLTLKEMQALREFAKAHKMTLSQIHRAALEAQMAGEEQHT